MLAVECPRFRLRFHLRFWDGHSKILRFIGSLRFFTIVIDKVLPSLSPLKGTRSRSILEPGVLGTLIWHLLNTPSREPYLTQPGPRLQESMFVCPIHCIERASHLCAPFHMSSNCSETLMCSCNGCTYQQRWVHQLNKRMTLPRNTTQ